MNKTYFIFFLFFYCIYSSQSIKGFRISDSLKDKKINELNQAYDKIFRIDNDKAELYANTILVKGKKEQNKDAIFDGYYKLAHTKGLKRENGTPYADTLFALTQHLNTNEYPARTFIIKGILYSYEFKYKQALDEYIKAQNLAKKKNNIDQYYYIKKLIGVLKTTTGENDESLSLFLEYYNYQKKKINSSTKDIKNYLGAIFSVANAYNKLKQYKQSKLFNKLGISECKKYDDYNNYPYFIMSEGISDYYLKNYNEAFVNFSEIEQLLVKNKDYANLSILYYYKGKVNKDLNKEKDAIIFLKKSDSVSKFSKGALYTIRDGYEILIDYYKKKADKENQLKYINKLVYADSIINSNQNNLSKEIYKKYDTPVLLNEKEKLITDLNSKNNILFWALGIGSLLFIILSFLFVKNKNKIKLYQSKANLLAKSQATDEVSITPTEIKDVQKEKAKISLSDHTFKQLGIQLEEFENAKRFLDKKINLDVLSKEFNTNRVYLSKAVNELKGKNFPQYLNELRIQHIIEELKTNKNLQKLTIAGVAEEAGFNNAESFTNAFKKITGTLPSYFIKVLQE
ncbi:hypothetical protein IW15_14950 [Chryseobacterium soli]|uniref:HTH araC/xylS-type domain-containing protein n=1 Tax=Chryseobacterium soli TaxID=445961 RepID=A0A086A496_9FLAO|nr:helix-turn-helix domain-containing protein [Chryseobacterium soli]KFF11510.1 hypothetical protein IW15_14950 [Chryseobacterium soli]